MVSIITKLKSKRELGALAVAIAIFAVLFSPYPGIDAVTISLDDTETFVDFTGGVLADVDDILSMELVVRNPAENGISFTADDGSSFNSETLLADVSVLRVVLNPGDSDEVVAFFDLSGNRLSNTIAANFGQTADVEGKIVALNFDGISANALDGSPGDFGYGNFGGFGYGNFANEFGTGVLGDGSYGRGLSSNPLGADTKASYDIQVNSGLLKEGENTVRIDVLPSATSADFFSSVPSTFTNVITGTVIEANVPVGSDGDDDTTGIVAFAPSSDLSTLNVIFDTLPDTITASDGQLLDFNGAPTFDDQDGVKSVRVSDSAVEITSDVSSATVTVSYPDGIVVSGSSDDWAGTITVPSVSTAAPPASNDVVGLVFSVGDGNNRLTFDQAVRLLLPGQAEQDGAFFSGEDADGNAVSQPLAECSFVPVNQATANANLEAGTALESCFTRAGSDMIIWTTHFGSFGSFTASEPAPTVLLSTTANPINNLDTIPFTATFSGDVEDFELADITVTGTANGGSPVASNLVGSGTEYTFDVVRGTTDGTVTVSIAAGTVTSGGVEVTASNEITVEIDTQRPTVALSAPNITNSNTITFTATFGEDVQNFELGDITVTGTANSDSPVASNLRGDGSVYTFDVLRGSSDGTVTASIDEDLAADLAGNLNVASAPVTATMDTSAPTVSVSSSEGRFSSLNTVPFTVTFDEDVRNFELGDITVTGTANGNSPAAASFVTVNARTYTFDVARGTSDGTVIVSINADVAEDFANNSNTASRPVTITIDTSPGQRPIPIITTADDFTNLEVVQFTVTFNKNAFGLHPLDLDVSGTANGGNPEAPSINAIVNERVYTFDVARGSSDGTITVFVKDQAAIDDSDEFFSTASNTVTVTIDTAPLTVSVDTDVGDSTNSDTIPFTATFNKDVRNFELNDITVTGTANAGSPVASNLQTVDARTYTFDVARGTTDGTVAVLIDANVTADLAGNDNDASAPVIVTIDTVPLTVSVDTTADENTNLDTIPFTATFSKDVENFELADITVTGTANGGSPAASNFVTVDARTYTFEVTRGTTDGTVTASIAADVAADSAGNSNTVSAPVTITIDTLVPTVTITPADGTTTGDDPVTFTATFSEAVRNFELGDITVAGTANGGSPAASNFVTVDARTYTFEVARGTTDGTVIPSIAADVAADSAGNSNTVSAPVTITIDTLVPTVTITPADGTTTGDDPVTFTATFSEAVRNFELGDITVAGTANGGSPAASNFVTVDARTYTFEVARGTTDGTVIPSIAADVAADSAGNSNTASAPVTVIIDTFAPTVSVSSSAGSSTGLDTVPFTVEFSEDVREFILGDITLDGTANGGTLTASNFVTVDARTYTFSVAGISSDGTVIVFIAANVAADLAGNSNTASVPTTVTVDTNIPTVSLDTTVADPTNSETIDFTATFSEDVTEFIADDIVVTIDGFTITPVSDLITAFSGSGTDYAFTVTHGIIAGGQLTVTIPANAVVEGNTASDTTTFTVDRIVPTVTITPVNGTTTSDNPVTFTATFSEDVENFELADITVTGTANGGTPAASNFVTVDASTYTFDVARGTTDGTVISSIAADVAADLAGNTNTASNLVTVTVDTSVPSVSLDTDEFDPTFSAAIEFTARFDRDVTQFVQEDIVVAINGTDTSGLISAFSGSGADYAFTVTHGIATQGELTVTIPDDAVAEGNTASTRTLTVDRIRPSVSITPADGTTTSDNPVTFTATFSEDVENFELGDITVTGSANGTNPAATNFVTVDARTYTFDVARGISDGTVTASIAADVAADLAGNLNTASNSVTVTITTNTLPPVPAVTPDIPLQHPVLAAHQEFSLDDHFTDPEGDTLSYTNISDDCTGTLTQQPPAGSDTFRFVSSDAETCMLSFDISDGTDASTGGAYTVNISVVLDAAPVRTATPLTVDVLSSQPRKVTLDINDYYTDANTLTLVSDPTSDDCTDFNSAILSNGQFDFEPINAFASASTCTVQATFSDGNRHTDTEITINYLDAATVSLDTDVTDPTNSEAIPFTATFGSDVTGFIADDIVVTIDGNPATPGSLITAFNGSGADYAFTVTHGITAEGQLTVTIPANAVVEGNTASTATTFTVDRIVPTVTITPADGTTTGDDPVRFTATFSEDVQNFELGDITVTGTANASNPVASNLLGDGSVYTFDVARGSTDGTVTVSIAADTITDAAGNTNEAFATTVTIDTTVSNFLPPVPAVPPVITLEHPTLTPPTFSLDDHFTDPDGDTLSYTQTAENCGGPLTQEPSGSGMYEFTPQFPHTCTISFDISDGTDASTGGAYAVTIIVESDPRPTIITDLNIEVQPDQSRTVVLDVNELFEDNKELAFSATGHSSNDCTSAIITVQDPPTTLSFDPNDDSAEQCEVRVRLNDGNRDDAGYNVTIQYVSTVTVSLSTTANPITNLETIPFTATFSGDVTGFVQSDIAVAINGTETPNLISAFSGSGTDYAFTVTHGIATQGELTVTIPDGAAAEGNTASTTTTLTVDRIVPTVSITPVDGTITGDDPVTFTATFSEDVQNFELGDITVTGTANGGTPAASNFVTVDARTYTFDVARGTTDGTIIPSIAADVATDLAGNSNEVSAPVTVTIDSTIQSVSLSTTAADLTNSETVEFTATFSGNVTGFVQSDIVVAIDGIPASNSLITAFSGSGADYTFTVTHGIAAEGELTVTIPVNAVAEGNTASTHTLTVDRIDPSVTITPADGTTTRDDTVTFTVEFSEDVQDFVLSDITVSGFANDGSPTASNFVTVDARTYTFDVVRGSTDGTVNVLIDEGELTDLAGNPNTGSNSVTVTIDTVPLTVSVVTTAGDNTNLATIPFTATFNKDVGDFDLTDITVTGTANGGSPVASNLGGTGSVYTFDVARGTTDGTVTVSIDALKATDAAGNSNEASAQITVTIDTIAPTVSVSSSIGHSTGLDTVPFTVEFSEDVQNFELGDITVTGTANGGTPAASNLVTVNDRTYTFDVARGSLDGTVIASIAAGVATDLAGNTNEATTSSVTVTINTSIPYVSLSTTAADPTNFEAISFNATFSEDVTEFIQSDITVAIDGNTSPNSLITAFTVINGTHYDFTVTHGIATEGELTVTIPENVVAEDNTDAVHVIAVDRVNPTVTITLADGTATTTGDDQVTFTATFSEDVQNFELGDITVTGTANDGTPAASNIDGDGSVYTFNVARGSTDGTIVVSIAADVATDLAGNLNTASAPVTVTINTTEGAIEADIPLGSDVVRMYQASPNLITLNVVHDTLPETIFTTDGQLLDFNGAPTFGTANPTVPKSVTISDSVTVVNSTLSDSQTVTVTYPANVVVSDSSGDWTGRIAVPSLSTGTAVPPTANDEIGLAFSVGDDNTRLTFDQAVRLLLPGQASHDGAFFSEEVADGVVDSRSLVVCPFVPVNQATANTNLEAGSTLESCFVRDGSDMIIWTTHFSSFGSFSIGSVDPTPSTSSSSRGGGGGSSGGGGGGGASLPSSSSSVANGASAAVLYDVQWDVCESNTINVIAGPVTDNLSVKLRTYAGVITAERSDDQSYPGRISFDASLSPNESFVHVQVENIVSRGISTDSKSLNITECSGSVSVNTYESSSPIIAGGNAVVTPDQPSSRADLPTDTMTDLQTVPIPGLAPVQTPQLVREFLADFTDITNDNTGMRLTNFQTLQSNPDKYAETVLGISGQTVTTVALTDRPGSEESNNNANLFLQISSSDDIVNSMRGVLLGGDTIEIIAGDGSRTIVPTSAEIAIASEDAVDVSQKSGMKINDRSTQVDLPDVLKEFLNTNIEFTNEDTGETLTQYMVLQSVPDVFAEKELGISGQTVTTIAFPDRHGREDSNDDLNVFVQFTHTDEQVNSLRGIQQGGNAISVSTNGVEQGILTQTVEIPLG